MSNKKIESKIKNCKKCLPFGYNHPKSPAIYVGEEYKDVLIVGEFPPRDWQITGHPFLKTDSGIYPSAKRIYEYMGKLGFGQEEFAVCEAIKCVLKDKRAVKTMAKNCAGFLKEQIEGLKPKMIISIGKTAAEAMSDLFDDDFDICNIYELENFTYIPLWHPSPVNPKGHAKNLEFLKGLSL